MSAGVRLELTIAPIAGDFSKFDCHGPLATLTDDQVEMVLATLTVVQRQFGAMVQEARRRGRDQQRPSKN